MQHVTVSPPVLTELLDSAPAGVLVAQGDGRILYANAALARLFGYKAGALLEMRVEDLLPARYRGTHEMFRAGCRGAWRWKSSLPGSCKLCRSACCWWRRMAASP